MMGKPKQLEKGLDESSADTERLVRAELAVARRDDESSHRTPPLPEDTQADDLPPPPQGKFNTHTVSRTDPDSATVRRRGQGVTVGYRDHSLGGRSPRGTQGLATSVASIHVNEPAKITGH